MRTVEEAIELMKTLVPEGISAEVSVADGPTWAVSSRVYRVDVRMASAQAAPHAFINDDSELDFMRLALVKMADFMIEAGYRLRDGI